MEKTDRIEELREAYDAAAADAKRLWREAAAALEAAEKEMTSE